MNNNSKLNIKKLIFIVLKIIIFFASVYFIYARIEHSNVNFIDVIESISIIYLFPIIILMFLNWFLEAIKWKLSANILEPLSFIKAIKGTFSGVTISSVLPNRTGDFLGKVLFLSEGNKKEGILIREIDYDKIDKVRGMDVSIVTSANTDKEALELLKGFNFPFN